MSSVPACPGYYTATEAKWFRSDFHARHSQPVKDFLATGAATRLQLERLPGSASELNAEEGVWTLLTRRDLKHRCCQELDELGWELGLAIRRLRRTAHVLRAWFRQCGSGQ